MAQVFQVKVTGTHLEAGPTGPTPVYGSSHFAISFRQVTSDFHSKLRTRRAGPSSPSPQPAAGVPAVAVEAMANQTFMFHFSTSARP